MNASDAAQLAVKGHSGQVHFDGQFVTITRKGFLARATVGKGDKRIPVHSITAVQWKPAGPMVNGFIQFSLGGGNEARSRFGGQTNSAVRDENSVIFTRRQQPEFEVLRTAVEAAIVSSRQPAAVVPDSLDQLKKLAELRDSGVITAEEFAAKKSQLLGL